MPTINWTDAELDDLEAIFDMIAKDACSKLYTGDHVVC